MDHSFERLIRSSRAQSPSYRDFSSSLRDLHPPTRDVTRAALRDSLPVTIPYRSKSYQSDLHRVSHAAVPSRCDDRRSDFYKSDQSLTRSVTNLASNSSRHSLSTLPSSYVNSYSRHHIHHNHRVPSAPRTPVQINSRSRFHARSAYKAYRSRSVNRLDESDYTSTRSLRSTTPSSIRLPTAPSQYSSQSLLSSMRSSKSLSDIRATQARINNELSHFGYRTSTSIRNIDDHEFSHSSYRLSSSIRNIDDSDTSGHILNPDMYVRWLKNKWDMEEGLCRQQSQFARSRIDSDSIDLARRAKSSSHCSFPSRLKFSHDSWRHPKHPTFSKTIRGKTIMVNNPMISIISFAAR